MALGKIKIFHGKIVIKKKHVVGSSKRRLFCGKESRKLANFAFPKLYETLLKAIQNTRIEMDE